MKQDFMLSIIIPAYNEQDRIVPTLTHTLAYLARQSFASQIIVISDGSKDQTAAVAQRFAASTQVRVDVLEYHPNRGKGYAVRFGMLRGEGRILLFMDADYAVPIHYCEPGMKLIEGGCDVAIGSRALSGARVKKRQSFFRELSARIYTFLQNHYLGIHFPDTQCGFKLFTRPAAQWLFSRQKLDSVIFDPEILWLAQSQGYKIGQFPLEWRHVADSRIRYDNIRKSLFVFEELLRIKSRHAGRMKGAHAATDPRHGP